MSVVSIIRDASVAGTDLNVRSERLFIAAADSPLRPDQLDAIRANKPAIIMVLDAHATISVLRTVTMRRCMPMTPNDLTSTERTEAETLAAELAENGGLGQFVIDLQFTWNELSVRDRLMAAWCWEVAAFPPVVADAA